MNESRERPMNPFQTLYVTETLTDPDAYWNLFSPKIISGETGRLFLAGNVVLIGSNGTGKTMLLRLFSCEVQEAFLRHHKQLPLPGEKAVFGVGVNLIHSGFGSLGRRSLVGGKIEDEMRWPILVADLLNHHLCFELMRVLEFLGNGSLLATALGAHVTEAALDEFAQWLGRQDCWFGRMRSADSFTGLREQIKSRILLYREFFNWNRATLPTEVLESCTEIGVPLAVCREGLGRHGIVGAEQSLMVTIDQYETLLHTDYEQRKSDPNALGRAFCRVVNSLLARRDSSVSFKVGVRPYAWGRELRALGTDARVECGRDYQVVNLDEILRRKENSKSWVFPAFVEDVARRRIERFTPRLSVEDLNMKSMLRELTPEVAIERYCGEKPDRLMPAHEDWPRAWQVGLRSLYKKDKLSAKFAELWAMQTLLRGEDLPKSFPKRNAPWSGEWWKKERQDALLMRIASECRQRRLYGGWDDIVTLSAYNVLVFLSLCREIWDIHDRAGGTLKWRSIEPEVQSQGIRIVSESWYAKQSEFPGGSRRQDFVRRLGIGIRRALLEDRGLSYPGHNGFSVAMDEYENSSAEIRDFLEDAADFGALMALPHTTKERDGRPRRKFYLFPVLCPTLEIPAVRTKEPYYATIEEVASWTSETRPTISFRRKALVRRAGKRGRETQMPLFPSQRRKGKR